MSETLPIVEYRDTSGETITDIVLPSPSLPDIHSDTSEVELPTPSEDPLSSSE